MKRVVTMIVAISLMTVSAQAGLIGWEAENGSSASGTVSVLLGADFDPAQNDAGALSGTYITSETGGTGNAPGTEARTVSYSINFTEAGTYDIYARLYIEAGGGDDSMFYARDFGDADPTKDGSDGSISWCTVNGIHGTDADEFVEGAYFWINLSENTGGGAGETPSSLVVNSPGTLNWEIGAREDGLWIDAFALGTSGETFTDAQLSTAVTPEPATLMLLGVGSLLMRRKK